MADSRKTPDEPKAPTRRSRNPRNAPAATPAPAADATMTSPLPAVVPVDEPDARPSDAPTQTMAPVPAEPATVPPEPEPEPEPEPKPAPTPTPEPAPTPEPVRTAVLPEPAATPAAIPLQPAPGAAPAGRANVPPAPAPMPAVAAVPAAAPAMTGHEARAQRPPREPRPAPSYATAPTATATNPFAAVPASDYLRDVVAAALLLISLGLQWDVDHEANERIDVVLITILSVFSLAAGYLGRLGALGDGWRPGRIRLARLALNAPYFVMVLVYLAIDIARGGDLAFEGGVGAAIGVGLAGAVLAAQPRESEAGERSGRPWLGVVAFLGAVIAVGAVAGMTAALVRQGEGIRVTFLLWAMLVTLITLVLVVVPIVGTVIRDARWRLVLLALGGAAVVLLMTADDGYILGLEVETFHGLGFGYVLWPAAAAAAAAPGVRRLMTDHGPRARWIGGAVQLLTLTLVVGLLQVALLVVELVDDTTGERGTLVAALVFTVLYVLAALVARSALAQNQPQGTAIAVVVAAVLLLVGLVNLAVIAGDDSVEAGYVDQLFAFAIPVALVIMVAVGAQRHTNRVGSGTGPTTSLPPTPVGGPGVSTNLGTGPTTSLPVQPGPGVPASIALATDPRTPPATLASLAASAPEARPYVAGHANAYPALLDWLAALHDPAVDDALRRRPR